LPRETKRRETQVSCADDSNAPVSGSGREHLEDAAATTDGDAPVAEPLEAAARAAASARDLLAGDLSVHQPTPVRARSMAMGARRTPVSRVRA